MKNQCNRILVLDVENPRLMQAVELWALKTFPLRCDVLMLIRTTEMVTIGRHQNAWLECKLEKLQREGIFVFQRRTGGGALFIDKGCRIATFLRGGDAIRPELVDQLLLDALTSLGVDATRKGNNDFCVGDKKIAGCTWHKMLSRKVYQAAFFVDADMDKLGYYLSPNKVTLRENQSTSVHTRITNLYDDQRNITHDTLNLAIIEAYCRHFNLAESAVEYFDDATLTAIPMIRDYMDTISEPEFELPPERAYNFSHRFDWGMLDLHFDIDADTMCNVVVYSDCMYVNMIDRVPSWLEKVEMTGIEHKITEEIQAAPDLWKEPMSELKAWLTSLDITA